MCCSVCVAVFVLRVCNAMCCSALQWLFSSSVGYSPVYVTMRCSALQCVGALQCVAVCCSVLQRLFSSIPRVTPKCVSQYDTVCCSVVQCVVVC